MLEEGTDANRAGLASRPKGMAYVVSLRDCAELGIDRVGAKAWNLSQLLVRDFPVPDGFVLTTQAFERFLASGPGFESSPEAMAATELPDDVKEELLIAAASLGNVPVAVRSSGVAEDLPGAS